MLDVYLVNGNVYLCHSYCDLGKVSTSRPLSLPGVCSLRCSALGRIQTYVVLVILVQQLSAGKPAALSHLTGLLKIGSQSLEQPIQLEEQFASVR